MQNNNGWIALHRQIQYHWLWNEKPFSKAQAWIDLLMMANREDKKFLLGNELLNVEAGTVVTSEVKLAERWGWSRCKTRAFLDLLQSDGMIVKQSDNKKTAINIVNYVDYSVYDEAKRKQKDSKKTSKRQQKDTNNNNNNNNNNSLSLSTITATPPAFADFVDREVWGIIKTAIAEVDALSDEAMVNVGRKLLKAEYVKEVFARIEPDHIRYAMDVFRSTKDIKKPKDFIQGTLYNAVIEMDTKYLKEAMEEMEVYRG